MIHRVSNVWKISYAQFDLGISNDIYTLSNANANNQPCKGAWTRISNNVVESLTITGSCYSEPASSLIIADLVGLPQRTTAQILAINNTKNGSLVFDANKLLPQIYRNNIWENLSFELPFLKSFFATTNNQVG